MPRVVIFPDVALRLAQEQARLGDDVQLLAPTLLRSQVLSNLYVRARRGELSRDDARRHLDFIRGLKVRLLGDRVLQARAWAIAERLDWSDTLDAEYVALTELQADALVTLDERVARAIGDTVALAPYAALLRDPPARTVPRRRR